MSQRSIISVGATMLVASLALSACGTRGGGSDSSDGGDGDKKVVKIGVIAPLSGDLSALGLGIQHSVELAAKQANESGELDGWTIEVEPKDDTGNKEPGQNAATDLVADEQVAGVVGTLNSSVAEGVQPILDKADVVMVSPANTNPTLTRGPKPAEDPKRTYANYFRTCTTDAVQGPFAARYLYETAKITEVATINDKKTYGQGLSEAFTAEYEKLGGTVHLAGKPHRPIYDVAARAAELAGGRLLCIGDGLYTDIRGANAYGADALLVEKGIHEQDLAPFHADMPALAEELTRRRLQARYVTGSLA